MTEVVGGTTLRMIDRSVTDPVCEAQWEQALNHWDATALHPGALGNALIELAYHMEQPVLLCVSDEFLRRRTPGAPVGEWQHLPDYPCLMVRPHDLLRHLERYNPSLLAWHASSTPTARSVITTVGAFGIIGSLLTWTMQDVTAHLMDICRPIVGGRHDPARHQAASDLLAALRSQLRGGRQA